MKSSSAALLLLLMLATSWFGPSSVVANIMFKDCDEQGNSDEENESCKFQESATCKNSPSTTQSSTPTTTGTSSTGSSSTDSSSSTTSGGSTVSSSSSTGQCSCELDDDLTEAKNELSPADQADFAECHEKVREILRITIFSPRIKVMLIGLKLKGCCKKIKNQGACKNIKFKVLKKIGLKFKKLIQVAVRIYQKDKRDKFLFDSDGKNSFIKLIEQACAGDKFGPGSTDKIMAVLADGCKRTKKNVLKNTLGRNIAWLYKLLKKLLFFKYPEYQQLICDIQASETGETIGDMMETCKPHQLISSLKEKYFKGSSSQCQIIQIMQSTIANETAKGTTNASTLQEANAYLQKCKACVDNNLSSTKAQSKCMATEFKSQSEECKQFYQEKCPAPPSDLDEDDDQTDFDDVDEVGGSYQNYTDANSVDCDADAGDASLSGEDCTNNDNQGISDVVEAGSYANKTCNDNSFVPYLVNCNKCTDDSTPPNGYPATKNGRFLCCTFYINRFFTVVLKNKSAAVQQCFGNVVVFTKFKELKYSVQYIKLSEIASPSCGCASS